MNLKDVIRKQFSSLSDRLGRLISVRARNWTGQAERERLRRALRRAESEIRWQSRVGAALAELYRTLISPDSTIEQMANTVLGEARSLTRSAHGYVSSIHPATGDNVALTITAMSPPGAEGAAAGGGVTISRHSDGGYDGLRGYALNTGMALFTNSPATHPAFAGYPEGHIPVTRFLSVPVILAGKPAGQIAAANSMEDYTDRDLEAVRQLAGFYALALQRKQAQERTVAALREKEVLLREIHHRVKNNLQVISSLLHLQAGCVPDPRAREILKESQNRVRSMAMVHEQLHRSRDLSRINFAEYIRNLVASLFCSYGIDSATVTLRLVVGDASFSIDTAIPCGLIIQELVSNSLKHAFPDGRPGEIRVELQRQPENAWVLIVADDGLGLPDQAAVTDGGSLGLRLVRILADQLEATVECISEKGTEFRITFSELPR